MARREAARYCRGCRKVLTKQIAHCEHPQCPWCAVCVARRREACK